MNQLILAAMKSRLTKRPFSLDFAITFRCNARCVQCNIWKGKNTGKELSISEIRQIFHSYKGLKSFGITGGEVFLRSDLEEILSIVAETQNPQIMFITTNGSFPKQTEKIVSRFTSNYPNTSLKVLISVDGPPEIHNRLRGFQISDLLLDTIQRLTDLRCNRKNLDVGTVTLYSPYNYVEYDKVLNYIEKLINQFNLESTFCFYYESYYYQNDKRSKLFIYDLRKYLTRMKKLMTMNMRQSKMLMRGRLKTWDLVQKWTENPGRQIIPCKSGTIRFVLNPYGVLYPCFIFDKPIADLRSLNYNLSASFKTDQAKAVRSLISKGACPGCCLTCELTPSLMSNLLKAI